MFKIIESVEYQCECGNVDLRVVRDNTKSIIATSVRLCVFCGRIMSCKIKSRSGLYKTSVINFNQIGKDQV